MASSLRGRRAGIKMDFPFLDQRAKNVAAQASGEPNKGRYSGRIAARLRQLRKKAEMTPPQMAAELLALRATAQKLAESNPLRFALLDLPDTESKILARVRHYEAGRAALPTDSFPAWAKVLGVDESELLPKR